MLRLRYFYKYKYSISKTTNIVDLDLHDNDFIKELEKKTQSLQGGDEFST